MCLYYWHYNRWHRPWIVSRPYVNVCAVLTGARQINDSVGDRLVERKITQKLHSNLAWMSFLRHHFLYGHCGVVYTDGAGLLGAYNAAVCPAYTGPYSHIFRQIVHLQSHLVFGFRNAKSWIANPKCRLQRRIEEAFSMFSDLIAIQQRISEIKR